MALDLQTVHPKNLIPISRTRIIATGGLRILEVHGENFSNVESVYINDIVSPDVVVVDRGRLLAQIPSSLYGSKIANVSVLSRTVGLTAQSILKFVIGNTPHAVNGPTRLVQVFVKLLLSEPGSDIFNRNLGGGALRNVGASIGRDQGNNIKAEFAVAVDRVAKQIIQMQSRDGTLPRDERLMDAKLVGAVFVREEASMYVTIEIVAQSGKSMKMNLEI